MAYTTATVNAWYQAVQFQNGPTSAVNTWVAALNAGTITPAQVQNSIITQDTYTLGVVNPVLRLYQAAFGSVPDQPGQAYWVGQFGSGAQTYQQMANGFANSNQFKTAYGTTGATQAATSAVVTTMYYNILLRAPDAGGLAYWTGKAIGDVLAGISTSPEMIQDMATPITNYQSAEIAGNPATSGSMYQYPGFPTTNYTLTTGVDAPGTGAFSASPGAYSVGSNTTVYGAWNGGTATLTPGDVISAAPGASNVNLNLQDNGSVGGRGNVNSVPVTVSGVTNLVVNSAEAVAFNGVNGQGGFGGLTQFTATTASGGGTAPAATTNADTITVAATTNVTITDTAVLQTTPGPSVAAGGVVINGGKNITITENGQATQAGTPGASGISIGGTTAAAGAVNVTVNAVSGATNGGTTSVSVDGGTTVSVTSAQSGSIAIGATTRPTGAVTVNDTSAGAGTITIKGGTNINVANAGTGTATIGDASTSSQEPTGTVSVTQSSTGSIAAYGGTTVTTTTNGGSTTIGAAGTGLTPTGAVTVTANSAVSGAYPSAVTTKAGAVSVIGGTAVTVNTGGGASTAGPGVATAVAIGSSTYTATGAVNVTDTNSTYAANAYGGNSDIITVLGGTTVNITTTANQYTTTPGPAAEVAGVITVGAVGALAPSNTALSSTVLAQTPTGNVTISSSTAAYTAQGSSTTVYGTANANVYTLGATSVSLTGVGSAVVFDNNNFAAAAGPGSGSALGTSTLTTVSVTGDYSPSTLTISSGVLSTINLTNTAQNVTNGGPGAPGYAAQAAHTLNLALNSYGTAPGNSTVTDSTATGFAITTSGASSTSNYITLAGAAATNVTFSNANALTLNGLTMKASATDTITANNTAALNLGTLTSTIATTTYLASINGANATGSITATIDPTKTTFTGGSGADVLTISANGVTKALNGGTGGNNTLVANYASAAPDSALGSSSYISNFTTLGLGASAASPGGSYDATNFTALTMGGVTDSVVFSKVAAGVGLSITANPGTHGSPAVANTTTLRFAPGTAAASTFNLTLGIDGASGTSGVTANTVTDYIGDSGSTGVQTIALTSLGTGTGTNTVTLADGGTATTLTIAGDTAATVTYGSPSSISTITVTDTAAVNTQAVVTSSSGVTITGGAGALTTQGGQTYAYGSPAVNTFSSGGGQVDVINSGAGGATIKVGVGGATFNNFNSSLSAPAVSIASTSATAGSETINLANSTGTADTININNNTYAATYNTTSSEAHDAYSTFATVNNFVVASNGSAGDSLSFTDSTNGTATAYTKQTLAANSSPVLASSGNETYTVANGIITFTGTGGAGTQPLSTQISDARAIVRAANSGADAVAAFVYGGNTYVVNSGHTSISSTADVADVTVLAGVTATNLGSLVGAGSVVGNIAQLYSTASTVTSLTTATTNVLNNNAAILQAAGNASAQTTTNTITNLASSATLTINNTGDSATPGIVNMGQVATTQTGAAGNNSLLVNLYSSGYTTSPSTVYDQAITVNKLTVSGDSVIQINASEKGYSGPSANLAYDTITSLVDGGATNTLTTIKVTNAAVTPTGAAVPTGGAGVGLYIGAITDTALTTIDASGSTGVFNLGYASGVNSGNVAINNLTIKLGSGGTTTPSSGVGGIYLSGNGDIITGSASSLKAGSYFLSGNSDSFTLTTAGTLGGAQAIFASGTGDTIDVSKATGTSSYTIAIQGATAGSAVGANAIINLGVGGSSSVQTVYAGTNTTVTIGGVYETINMTNTAAQYGTSGNIDYIKAAAGVSYATSDIVVLNYASTAANNAWIENGVNVSSATSLTSALNIAWQAAYNNKTAAIDGNHASADWFQYGGNTYVLNLYGTGASGTHSTTGIDTTDTVVKIAGLVDLGTANHGALTSTHLTNGALLL